MSGSTVRHWVETPARYQEVFSARGRDGCTLAHSLFALPGPSSGSHGKRPSPPGEESLAAAEGLKESGPAFQILLDVVQFCPEDILIQVFEGFLIVRAQHGRRMDEHGFVSRCFTRTYKLPPGVLAGDLSAGLCHDGILCVELQKRL